MSETAERSEPGEHDLHALIDGEIAGPRAWAVLVRLAADPDAAERAAAYARQRAPRAPPPPPPASGWRWGCSARASRSPRCRRACGRWSTGSGTRWNGDRRI